MKNDPYSKTVFRWLKANLGPKCLAPCTGQDMPAIRAAVHLAELWCASDDEGRAAAADAFRSVVTAMQPSTRYLAFHCIAHAGDWGHRFELWRAANLPAEWLSGAPDCSFAPRPVRVAS